MLTRRRTRALAVLTSLAAVLIVTSCTSDDPGGRPASTAHGTPGGRSVAANSPAIVAAAAVGTRSRQEVISLHAIATSTASGRGIPRSELPRQAAAIRTALRTQITDATRLPLPTNSAGAMLVLSLRSYERVAGAVASDAPASAWLGQLRAADDGWVQAMRLLSTGAKRNLLADMPPLRVPDP